LLLLVKTPELSEVAAGNMAAGPARAAVDILKVVTGLMLRRRK
jgi:hypothetical protein